MQRKRSVDFLLTVLTLVSGISSASYKVQNKMPKPKRSLSSSSEEEALFSDGKDQKKMTSNSQKKKKKKKKVHCFQDDEARKQEIRETNKLAARECRARKKRLMSELEKTVGSLTTEHTALVKQNRELAIRLETDLARNEAAAADHEAADRSRAQPRDRRALDERSAFLDRRQAALTRREEERDGRAAGVLTRAAGTLGAARERRRLAVQQETDNFIIARTEREELNRQQTEAAEERARLAGRRELRDLAVPLFLLVFLHMVEIWANAIQPYVGGWSGDVAPWDRIGRCALFVGYLVFFSVYFFFPIMRIIGSK